MILFCRDLSERKKSKIAIKLKTQEKSQLLLAYKSFVNVKIYEYEGLHHDNGSVLIYAEFNYMLKKTINE